MGHRFSGVVGVLGQASRVRPEQGAEQTGHMRPRRGR
jgi:hypothetical protein